MSGKHLILPIGTSVYAASLTLTIGTSSCRIRELAAMTARAYWAASPTHLRAGKPHDSKRERRPESWRTIGAPHLGAGSRHPEISFCLMSLPGARMIH